MNECCKIARLAIDGKCPVCQEPYTSDEDLFVHVYICHPELNDNISKMLNGEPYETAEQLRARGILPLIGRRAATYADRKRKTNV